MLLATFLEATLGGPKFVHRVLSHLRIHRLEVFTVCQGTPWNCMLASKRTWKKRNLNCSLLVKWMVGLLEALLVLLLEVLLEVLLNCSVLLDGTKVLVTRSYNVLICLKFDIVFRFLVNPVFVLLKIQLFQFKGEIFHEKIDLAQNKRGLFKCIYPDGESLESFTYRSCIPVLRLLLLQVLRVRQPSCSIGIQST